MGRNHTDARSGTVLRAWLRERDDGETELVIEGEAWVPKGADAREYLGNGLSISGFEGSTLAPILLGPDSMNFDDEALDEVRQLLLDSHLETAVGVDPYYQFAELPPPVIVIQLSDPAFVQILYGAAAAAVYDVLKTCVHRLVQRNKQPKVKPRLRISVGDIADVDLLLPVAGDDLQPAIDAAFDGVVRIIEATRLSAADADDTK